MPCLATALVQYRWLGEKVSDSIKSKVIRSNNVWYIKYQLTIDPARDEVRIWAKVESWCQMSIYKALSITAWPQISVNLTDYRELETKTQGYKKFT